MTNVINVIADRFVVIVAAILILNVGFTLVVAIYLQEVYLYAQISLQIELQARARV